MKRTLFLMITVLALSTVILAACGGGTPAETAPQPPAEYAGKTNPFANQADAATAGGALYAERCASCHGATGAGDGPAAAALDPKPANLATVVGDQADDFLFWRIMEGGAVEPFNSSMPAQKGILTDDQVWQLVTFIRTLAK